jgi:hypothetical protein
MSPSEFDLRAALQDGEGNDALNVDQLVLAARAHHSQRRTRILSTAAVVVAVAALGVGGGYLASHGASNNSTASRSAVDNAKSAAQSRAGSAGSATFGTEGSGYRQAPVAGGASRPAPSAVLGCPSTLPSLTPTGGATAAVSGPLFSKPVRSVLACAYSATTVLQHNKAQAVPGHAVLQGTLATQLADSLEKAPAQRPQVMCPDLMRADAARFAFIGLAGDGTQAGTVTTTAVNAGCGAQLTNGRVTRYGWTPPASVQRTLARISPSAGGTAVPIPSQTK